jgi:4-carboxymuconolactone decarboxylase
MPPVDGDNGVMDEPSSLDAAREMRRAILGDAYVDAQTADPNPTMREFQEFVTSTAWGTWARSGPLSPRDRSLLVIAMTAALGRMDEFRLHARSSVRAGVSADELDELLFMIAAYCGMPAGVSAKHVLGELRAGERDPG